MQRLKSELTVSKTYLQPVSIYSIYYLRIYSCSQAGRRERGRGGAGAEDGVRLVAGGARPHGGDPPPDAEPQHRPGPDVQILLRRAGQGGAARPHPHHGRGLQQSPQGRYPLVQVRPDKCPVRCSTLLMSANNNQFQLLITFHISATSSLLETQ